MPTTLILPPPYGPIAEGCKFPCKSTKNICSKFLQDFVSFLGAPFNCIFNQSKCTDRQRCIVIGQMFGKLVLQCSKKTCVSIILHNIFENPINVITPLHIWWLCAELYLGSAPASVPSHSAVG